MKDFRIEDSEHSVTWNGHNLTNLQIKILILRLIGILSRQDKRHNWHLTRELKK